MNSSLNSWPKYSREEIKAVEKILSEGRVNYWTGNVGKLFEKEFSLWAGAKHAIALSNGTVALDLALKALEINSEDEVIVTPRSFIASASSVVNVGANPVFADVDRYSGNISANFIEEKITKKTKAIICVHLGGLPCDMDEIIKLAKKYKLHVIEDCAQAHGATYKGRSVGSIGDIGAWSFCQDKIMTTGGEGGMVTTSNKSLWEKMWSYKDHGKSFSAVNSPSKKAGFKWVHDSFGTNLRMTEMQAAIGLIQLKKMEKWNKLRTRNANLIIETLKEFPNLVELAPIPNYVRHAYYRVYGSINKTSLSKFWSRDQIIEEINRAGVPCFSGSCPEIYREKAFSNSIFAQTTRLKGAKLLGESSIAFLCHPSLTLKDIKFMKNTIHNVLKDASC